LVERSCPAARNQQWAYWRGQRFSFLRPCISASAFPKTGTTSHECTLEVCQTCSWELAASGAPYDQKPAVRATNDMMLAASSSRWRISVRYARMVIWTIQYAHTMPTLILYALTLIAERRQSPTRSAERSARPRSRAQARRADIDDKQTTVRPQITLPFAPVAVGT
jgi:hypothetical protein